MLKPTEKQFTVLYAVIVLFELITAQVPALGTVHYIAKPAIVISLIALVVNQKDRLKLSCRILLLLALCFSVAGDSLLMFVHLSEWYFILGLISFLIAHLFYLVLFFSQRQKSTKPFLPIILLFIYSFAFGCYITDALGDMLIPVIGYEIVIFLMASSSFFRKGAVSSLSYKLVTIGALVFLISDSILAVNKFHYPIPLSGIWIMVTYALAQYFIVIGILRSKTVTSDT